MKKFSSVSESSINLGVTTLNTELVYLTENNHQVGSLLLVYEGDKSSVYSLQVLETHRKKGYGRKLMEKAILRSKERGCQSMELNTEVDNNSANKLYQSMDFNLNGLKFGFNNYTKDI
jgi:ribosomal protein S18 acetylase RimI-like enzyme